MLAQLNECIGGSLHLGPNVITFKALLHLGPNVITFRTLLHLGKLLHLGLQHRKPIGQRDLLASTKMDQDFPGKVTHCRHVYFLSRSHRGALKRTTQ